MPYGGAATREDALLLAVREFMNYELKIKPHEQDKMVIDELFEKKSENLDTVYVKFKYRSSLSMIFERAKSMRKESQLVTYVPREFQELFQALNEKLKVVRMEGEGWRTRVKVGREDLIVYKKKKQIGAVFEYLDMDLSDLPPVCLTRPKVPISDSPPPGRPGHRNGEGEEARKRRRSGLTSGLSPTNKSSRNEGEDYDNISSESEEDEDTRQEAGNDVANEPDRVKTRAGAGGYCGPPTISPVKVGQGLLTKPNLGEVIEEVSSVKGKVIKTVRQKNPSKTVA